MSASTQIGRVLAGKYRIEHPLGSGAMGTVVAATHLGLGRKVALKFMRVPPGDDGEATTRFLREARAAATLRSEHVAQVLDVDVDGDVHGDQSTPYIVMEYLEGQDLRSCLEKRGALPAPEAVDHVLQACEGLAEAHAKGIVHRDLKPANLFLTRRPDGAPLVKILDFGISKLSEASPGAFRLTQPRAPVGSPEYMSPEQMLAAPELDARADVWSLGVILYELLAGAPPFQAHNFVELGMAVTNKPHLSLARRIPGLAPGLVATVDRCLAKTPAARFPHLAALAAALAPHGGPNAIASAARTAGVLGLRPPTPTAGTPRARARAWAPALAAAGGIALLICAGAIFAARDVRPPPAPVAPERAANGQLPAASVPQSPPLAPARAAAPDAAATATASAASSDSKAAARSPARPPGRRSRPRASSSAEPGPAPAAGKEPARPAATPTRRGPILIDL